MDSQLGRQILRKLLFWPAEAEVEEVETEDLAGPMEYLQGLGMARQSANHSNGLPALAGKEESIIRHGVPF